MNATQIAAVCHAVNAAYCRALGDNSQPPWEEAPVWQQRSAVLGVNFHLANPDASPAESHESWLSEKTADGWKYGPIKDPEKREHPCFRPYSELPIAQRVKDYLFKQVVNSLRPFYEA